jgi:hypothetical protein
MLEQRQRQDAAAPWTSALGYHLFSIKEGRHLAAHVRNLEQFNLS